MEYLAFVTATLGRMKESGAIAIKSEIAYLRPLGFQNVSREEARAAFDSGTPSAAEYGANPMLLEPLVQAHRGTTFVLIHGGYPFTREVGAMLVNPNVYADFSAQTFLSTPEALSRTLRDWLN